MQNKREELGKVYGTKVTATVACTTKILVTFRIFYIERLSLSLSLEKLLFPALHIGILGQSLNANIDNIQL